MYCYITEEITIIINMASQIIKEAYHYIGRKKIKGELNEIIARDAYISGVLRTDKKPDALRWIAALTIACLSTTCLVILCICIEQIWETILLEVLFLLVVIVSLTLFVYDWYVFFQSKKDYN